MRRPLEDSILPLMSEPAGANDRLDHQRLRPLFVLIVLTEILAITALFWFGRHFV